MLTRLRVSGFKNLSGVDVSFGPFTCIAGANGVGKSNLLDAIVFLGALTEKTLVDAALSVRDQGARTGDILGLFQHVGGHFAEEMTFQVEMIIPKEGVDDLGQKAKASSTFVEYTLKLRHRTDNGMRALGSLELVTEELKHITLGQAGKQLSFHPSKAWKDSVLKNERRTPFFISTKGEGADRVINVHQDGGSSGKPQKLSAANLPRTVLSRANAAESPTATLARREMQSWRLLQLEPSSLREPDRFDAQPYLGSAGSHLPATLYRLAHHTGADPEAIYAEVANRLAELIDEVRAVHVDRDEPRQLLTIYATDKGQTQFPARALSDGTLRFLALAVLALDTESGGVLCLEEPENGIHPARIPAIIRLLKDLAFDPANEADEPGHMRQVIINTHSPAVVQYIDPEDLVVAETVYQGYPVPAKTLRLGCMPRSWRAKSGSMVAGHMGQLLPYLNPVPARDSSDAGGRSRRLVDRPEVKRVLPLFDLHA